MEFDFEQIYDDLFAYCEAENFSGYDPFEGLNSPFVQLTPLKYFAPARLAWLQMVKRSPFDLRPILRIEKGVNAKGIALFALAELSRFRTNQNTLHAANAKQFLNQLIDLKIQLPTSKNQKPKSAFGYNFDWQSRAFFAPNGTPTIVPTAFAAQAFIEAYKIFDDEIYLATANEICEFILSDLNRSFESKDEICFSYTPLDKSVIFNASLLAGETLANTGKILANEFYLETAAKTVRFVVRRQMENGAWAYGSKLRHKWVDNFHTAYILLSLFRISNLIPELKNETENALKTGLDFWLENFFLADGTSKYFDKSIYPVDIHSASAAIAALSELHQLDERCLPQAEKTLNWTIENMRDAKGFFYYQVKKNKTIKIPFIRWGQAWMAYALARFLEIKTVN
ncbi:exopolysaccharide biosynthesis protein VpsJ [soil metagenome]